MNSFKVTMILLQMANKHMKWCSTSPSVQFSSGTQWCPTVCDPMNCIMPGFPVHHHSRSSLKLRSIKSEMPSGHLILCHPLFLLPPIPPSIAVFSNESTLRMRWPMYRSFRALLAYLKLRSPFYLGPINSIPYGMLGSSCPEIYGCQGE